jgi:hypothetical protein
LVDKLFKTIAGAAAGSRTARAVGGVWYLLMATTCLLALAGGAAIYAALSGAPAALFLAAELGLLLAASALTASFGRLAELSGQHARDLEAQDLLARLKRGEQPGRPFTLYLRPFQTTDQIAKEDVAPQFAAMRGSAFSFTSQRYELEQQIEHATRRIGPLVALGQPMEHVGAGRILVGDTEWRDAVELLTQAASLIVLLPSSRPGTRWEVERILDSDLVHKTVMIDPPNEPERRGRRYRQEAEWGQVRAAFASRGYEMPSDSHTGAMVFFGVGRHPAEIVRLDMEAEESIAAFFRRILRPGAASPTLASKGRA